MQMFTAGIYLRNIMQIPFQVQAVSACSYVQLCLVVIKQPYIRIIYLLLHHLGAFDQLI